MLHAVPYPVVYKPSFVDGGHDGPLVDVLVDVGGGLGVEDERDGDASASRWLEGVAEIDRIKVCDVVYGLSRGRATPSLASAGLPMVTDEMPPEDRTLAGRGGGSLTWDRLDDVGAIPALKQVCSVRESVSVLLSTEVANSILSSNNRDETTIFRLNSQRRKPGSLYA